MRRRWRDIEHPMASSGHTATLRRESWCFRKADGPVVQREPTNQI